MAIYIGNQKVAMSGLVKDASLFKQMVEGTITEVTAEDLAGITKIRNNAFYKVASLQRVVLPEGITTIGSNSFYDCDNLESFVVPNSVTMIDSNAISDCAKLKTITIGSSVQKVYSNGFAYNWELETINYAGTIDQWVQIDFSSETSQPLRNSKANLYINGELLTTATISASTIKSYALSGCKSLESLILGDSVQTIGGYSVFANCTALTSVHIGSGLTKLYNRAFQGCTALTSIRIPSNVTALDQYALQIGSPDNKATIIMESSTPPSIYSSTFLTEKLEKIIVPQGSLSAYQTATNWSAWADYMEEATA